MVVRSDHGVQKDPEAILEVHRILLEHIGIDAGRHRAVQEARGPTDADPVQPGAVPRPMR